MSKKVVEVTDTIFKGTDGKEYTLPAEVTELKNKILPELTMNTDTGIIIAAEGVYERHLPAGITKEMSTNLRNYHQLLTTSAALATGTLGKKAMVDNPALNQVHLSLPTIGNDCIDVQYDRLINMPSKDTDGNPSMTPHYGCTTVKYTVPGKSNQVQAVKKFLSQEAMAAFGK